MYPAKPPVSCYTAPEYPEEIDFFKATHKAIKSSKIWISTGKNILASITNLCKVTLNFINLH